MQWKHVQYECRQLTTKDSVLAIVSKENMKVKTYN